MHIDQAYIDFKIPDTPIGFRVGRMWYAFGLSGTWNIGALSLNAEFDYLIGEDKINNPKIGNKQLVDLNNCDLSGYNLYFKGDYAVSDKVAVGAVFRLRSGDDDVTSGKGNANKLRTSGFFYITEVWEDSIMPDEEGITPQGLGAPNVRGYRELENTTILKVNTTLNLFADTTTWHKSIYSKTRLQHAMIKRNGKFACPLNLNPRLINEKQNNIYPYCFNCGECVDACQNKGSKAIFFIFHPEKRIETSSVNFKFKHTDKPMRNIYEAK